MKINDNINLILGNHGSGKSTYIYNYFLDNCKSDDLVLDLKKKFYLVVPEQDTHDKQNMFLKLAASQNHGIMNIDVISFDRLCYMVFKELNISINKESMIDDDIKRLVLRQAIQNLEKNGTNFIYFKNMKNKVGFTDKLKSAMSEFYSYNIDKELIDNVIQKSKNDKFNQKIKELSIIQEEFKFLLKKYNLTIQEDKLNLLDKLIEKSKICGNAIFAFDGFTGFTPIQKSIFEKICEKANEVYVSIDIRDVGIKSIVDNFGYKNDEMPKDRDVFYLSKLFINQIFDIATNQKKSIKEKNIIDLCKSHNKIYDKNKSKYNNNLDLSYLEENIYKKNVKKYDNKVENISIHACKNIEDEVDFLINKIEYLRREKGYRLNDIKVIVPVISEYADILIKKCEEININIYIDNKKTIYNSPIIEAIRSAFDVILYNFNYDSVMRYLNCGLFDKSSNNTIYLFDNAIRKYGIRGCRKYNELLEKKKTVIVEKKSTKFRDNIEEHIDEIINVKNEILNPLIDFYNDVSIKNKKWTVCEYIVILEKFMEKADLYNKFDDVLKSFEDKNDIDYLILKNNEDLIKSIIYKFKLLFSDDEEKIDFIAFKDLFNVSIENREVSISPFTMEELECGDLMRSRFDNPKALFFLGLNESRVLMKQQDNNIIDDYMRVYMKELADIELSQTTKETSLNQRYYVYLALSCPSEKLYLSYTSKNVDSVTDYPSSVIQNISSIFNIQNEDIIKENKNEYDLYTRKDMIDYVYRNIYDAKLLCKNVDNDIKVGNDELLKAKNTRNVLKYLKNTNDNKELDIEKKEFDTDNNVNKNIVNSIIGDVYSASVTKLENYATCPYKYFLEYTIGLKEREKYDIDNRDIGIIFHKVLEDVFNTQSFDINKCKVEDIEKNVKTVIDKIIEDNDKYKDTNYAIFLTRRVQDIVTYSICRLKENVELYDQSHIASEEKLLYDIKGTKDILSGKIDVIDNFAKDNNNYVRVVDYKSSDRKYDEDDLKSGVDIQYVVYLHYVLENLKIICEKHNILYDDKYMTKPFGTFYFQIHDNIKCLKRDEIEENKLNNIKGAYKYKGIVNSDVVNINENIKDIVEGKEMSEDDIKKVIEDVNENIKNNIKDIKDGKIKALPYKKLSKSCDVCKYSVICKKNLYEKVPNDIENIDNIRNE